MIGRSARAFVAVLFAAALSLFLSSRVSAYDGHGIVLAPGQGTVAEPLVVWSPLAMPSRGWSAGATLEYAAAPVVWNVTDGDSVQSEALLDDLSGLSLGATRAFGRRFGLGLTLPVWLFDSGPEGTQGPAPGDLRVWAPLAIVRPDGASSFGLSVVPFGDAPTGSSDRLLGRGAIGGGGLVAAGFGSGVVRGALNAGVESNAGQVYRDVDQRLRPCVAASVSVLASEQGAFRVEAWRAALPWEGWGNGSAVPAELLASTRVAVSARSNVTLGVATALGDGAGAAGYRMFAGLAFHDARPTVLAPVAGTAAGPAPPREVAVSVKDAQGNPVPAEVEVIGPAGTVATQSAPDGQVELPLPPGTYEVVIRSPGLGEQRRDLVVPEEVEVVWGGVAPEQDRIEAVLLPPAPGGAPLAMQIVDPQGRPVDGARVSVDGQPLGTTGSGGTIEVASLPPGPHRVLVDAPDFEAALPVDIDVAPGAPARTVVLQHPPGSVQVIARTAEARVADAVVRFYGPDVLPPEKLGAQGERIFVLTPGTWQVVVSSGAYGLQQREVVVERDRPGLITVDVVLFASEGGRADLDVRVVDPDGQPVDGAELLLGGTLVGSTSNGGALRLEGLNTGMRLLEVRGVRFLPHPPIAVELVPGLREVTVALDWKPGTVRVEARGPQGALVDAMVRFYGPEVRDPARLGADGVGFFELPPGEWTVVLSAEALGVQQRDVVVRPDETSLIAIEAIFERPRTGSASIEVRVKDSGGAPIDGARVMLDGVDLGATSTGGTLKIEGLESGTRTLWVGADLFEPWSKEGLALKAGANAVEARLAWKPGLVKVVGRDPEGKPANALVRLYGPDVLPSAMLGGDGERVFALGPGNWTIVLSSDAWGIHQQDVTVQAGQALVVVEVRMTAPPPTTAQLVIQVVDGDGRPVKGAEVRVGGKSWPAGEGGAVVLDGLQPATVSVVAKAPGYQPASDKRLKLVAGAQHRTLKLGWIDRPVRVAVRTDRGTAVDAALEFIGPARVAPVRTGTDGDAAFSLRPGRWEVIASADSLGAKRVGFDVVPGQPVPPVALVLADTRVEVTTGSVVIRERIQFEFGKDAISPDSMSLVEEVANNLLVHKEIELVEVQGHTDNVGTPQYNLDLSQRRAEAVRAALIARGVSARSLVAKGYGTSRPLADNSTEDGRARNRRVEFEILVVK